MNTRLWEPLETSSGPMRASYHPELVIICIPVSAGGLYRAVNRTAYLSCLAVIPDNWP